MLFKIDRSVMDDINDPAKQRAAIDGLEELARAYKKGFHIIFSDPDVLYQLKNYVMLSESARRIYQYLFNRYSEMRSIMDNVSKYVEVISDKIIQAGFQLECNGVIRISLKYISTHDVLSKAIFLAENLSDIRFYHQIASAFAFSKCLRSIRICYEPIGGGGHTIANQFSQIQSDAQRLCLAIVDSDKDYPTGCYGGTAQAILNTNNPLQGLCNPVILDVREVENLIPINLFEGIMHDSRERQNAYNLLNTINCNNARLFLDLKKGLYIFSVTHPTKPDFELYWRNVFGLWGINLGCLGEQDCLNNSDEKCLACKIFPGFGDPLPNIINIMERMTPQKISESFQGVIKPNWECVSSIILTWFCAHQPLYAV